MTATSGRWTPIRRQETVQLSFLSNIYEPLVRRDRDLSWSRRWRSSWEQTSPTVWRFHLRPDVKWQDGSPFTADDVVFSLQRILSQNSVMRAPMSPVKEARKIDDLTVDFETDAAGPDLPAGTDQLPDHVEGLVRGAQRDRAGGDRRQGRQLRGAQRDGHRSVQAGLARTRPQDRRGEEPRLVGQDAGQRRPRRVRRDRQRSHAGGGAAVRRRGHDLLRAAAGHAAHQPRRRACT